MKQSFLWVVLFVAGVCVPTQALGQDPTPAPPPQPAAQDGAGQTSDPVQQPSTTDAAPTEAAPPVNGAASAPGVIEETDVEEEVEPPKRIWRGSYMWWDQSLSAYSLAPGGQLTYNPTYAWNFRIVPRFYLRDDIFIAIRQDIDVEWTQSDSATYARQPFLSDTQISFVKTKIIDYEGFTLSSGPRLVLPLSIVSRANDVYFGIGGLVSANYHTDAIAKGFNLSFDTIYTHLFAGSNVTSTHVDYPCASPDARIQSQTCSQVGGPSTTSDTLFFGPTASISPITDLSVSLSFYWVLRRGRQLADATVQTIGGPVTLEDGSATHWRNSTFFYASVSYQIFPWLTTALNFWSFTPELNPNGSLRNPFFNYDSQISFTNTIVLDQLYDTLFGGLDEGAEGGTHRPSSRGGAF